MVSDVVEEVYLAFLEREGSSDGVDRSIAPSLVEEAACLIEVFEEVIVRLAAIPVEVRDLEIAPEMTVAPIIAFVLRKKVHMIVIHDMLRKLLHEVLNMFPEAGNRLSKLIKGYNETILLSVLCHPPERIVINVT